jgi:hypothetical protein
MAAAASRSRRSDQGSIKFEPPDIDLADRPIMNRYEEDVSAASPYCYG